MSCDDVRQIVGIRGLETDHRETALLAQGVAQWASMLRQVRHRRIAAQKLCQQNKRKGSTVIVQQHIRGINVCLEHI
jgi:hypothetical protein